MHEYIDELEEKVAKSRTAREAFRTLREVLTSSNAPKLAEAVTSRLCKSRDAETAARAEAAKHYTRAAIVSNVVFVLSLVLCLVFLGWVIQTLKPDKDLLLPVLSAVISLIAGAGGGYVFGRQSVPRTPNSQ